VTRREHHLVSSPGQHAPQCAAHITGTDHADLHLLTFRRDDLAGERQVSERGYGSCCLQKMTATSI
jgi:hypothetical protein